MRLDYFLLPAFAVLVFACGGSGTDADRVEDSGTVMDEIGTDASDWKVLFDGSSLEAWRNYGADTLGSAWKIDAVDNSLYLDVSDKSSWQTNNGGDIITRESYDDYELELEWKIGDCGNSGIIYNVTEDEAYDYVWRTGPEMQILDNSCHPDAKIYTHRAGDLYDMIAGDSTAVKAAGNWNKVRLVNRDGSVEHWMNGQKVVEYTNTGDEWAERIADSKFAEMPGFGKTTGGHIALQDHGDPVWFRNIRIREL